MTQFQDYENVHVEITEGGVPSPSVEDIGKMLWIEGFAYPTEKPPGGEPRYAAVTLGNIEIVLERLYEVQTPAHFVVRWLRQVGLVTYAEALRNADGTIEFRYTCAAEVRGREPKTPADVDVIIHQLAAVRALRRRNEEVIE